MPTAPFKPGSRGKRGEKESDAEADVVNEGAEHHALYPQQNSVLGDVPATAQVAGKEVNDAVDTDSADCGERGNSVLRLRA